MKALYCGLCLLLIICVGCSKSEGDKTGESTGDIEFSNAGIEFSYDSSIKNSKDPGFDCASAGAYAEGLVKEKDQRVKAVGLEVQKLCGYDSPLSWAEANVKKIEEAKKKTPDSSNIGECAAISVCLDTLQKKHKDDPKVKAVDEKYKAICPQ
ncbi:MAG: hypothetical protein JRJ19_16955 [Deltaproteobacteria bacterium]|nr:hypothetical protein [Deltaproteobacteria bacterium]